MPRTVPIVDDHEEFRRTARALLEADGFEVVGRQPMARRRSRRQSGSAHSLFFSTSIFMKLGIEESGDDHRRVLAVLAFLGS